MENKKQNKRAEARRARVGANRKKIMEEQRAQRPRTIISAAKVISKAAVIIALAAAAGYGLYAYAPVAFAGIADSVKSKRGLPSSIIITNCDIQTRARLDYTLDSLMNADSLGFDRATILKAAAAIPEIEKIRVNKTRDRASREGITRIKVTERKPVALVHCGDIFLVDKKGVRFAARPGQSYDLPLFVVDGAVSRDTVDLEIFNLIKKVSRNYGGDFFQQISQIDIGDGSSVRLYFKSGEAEYIVSFGDIENRLIHVKKLRDWLLENHGGPSRVDLRFRGLAYTSAW